MIRRRLVLLVLSFGLTLSFGRAAGKKDFHRIARLSYIEGHVSFQHPQDVDWTAASTNMPLQPADRIYTGEDGRAEIEFDDGSVLRLAEKTDVEILSLKEDFIQLRLLIGLATLGARSSVAFEVNTPAAAFSTLRKGVYRFDIAENGDSDGIVRKGLMEAANDNFSRRLEAGELIHVSPGQQGKHVLSRYDKRDDWDEWNDRRNADAVAYESRQYLPDYVQVGVRELDRYGRWAVVENYGPAWIPQSIGIGWSPYWEGRWCYRPLWGWTWVSYEPWGWLPYHYGRWYRSVSLGWCWLPGPSFSFHFWSPGLVRFYHGPSWVSWCPLGPGDYYNVNNYFYNSTYNYRLNDMRLTQRRGPEELINRDVPGAFRSARTDQFVNESLGPRVRTLQADGAEQPWQRGRLITDQLGIQPTARSYAPQPEQLAVRPDEKHNRPVVIRTEPTVDTDAGNRFSRITNALPTPVLRAQERNSGPEPTDPGPRTYSVGTGRGVPGASTGIEGNARPGIWNRSAPEAADPAERYPGRVYRTPGENRGEMERNRDRGRELPGSPATRPESSRPRPESTVPMIERPSESGYGRSPGRQFPGNQPPGHASPGNSDNAAPPPVRGYDRPAPQAVPPHIERGRPETTPRSEDPTPPIVGFGRGYGRPDPRPESRIERPSGPGMSRDASPPPFARPSWGGEGRPTFRNGGAPPAHIPGGALGGGRPQAPPPAVQGSPQVGNPGILRRRDN